MDTKFSANGLLASSSSWPDGSVRIWNYHKFDPTINTNNFYWDGNVLVAPGGLVAFSSDEKWLAVSNEERVKLWDLGTQKVYEKPKLIQPFSNNIIHIDFSPDSRRLLIVLEDGSLILQDLCGSYL